MDHAQDLCSRCGGDAFVVRAGSLVRVGVTGVPWRRDTVTDPFEAEAARCVGCLARWSADSGLVVSARLSPAVPRRVRAARAGG